MWDLRIYWLILIMKEVLMMKGLFPIPEQGMNYRANSLQKLELESMVVDCAIVERLMRSYCMVCWPTQDISSDSDENRWWLSMEYGWTGEIVTDYLWRKIIKNVVSPLPLSCTRSLVISARSITLADQVSVSNLSNRPHNLLRLTRILKLLSLFPTLSQLAAPLILFLTALHSEGHLDLSPGTMHGGSLDRWWVNCLRDKALRKEVTEIVRRRGKKGEGKWGMNEWTEWFDAKLVEGIVWAGGWRCWALG